MAEENTQAEDTFISHLIELRSRIVKAAAVVLVVFLCLMPFAAHIFDVLAAPMIHALPAGSKMIATGVITPFLIPIKVTMLVAVLIALPWVLYQLWAFVAPGLYAHEKRLIAPLVISSICSAPSESIRTSMLTTMESTIWKITAV